MCEKSKCQQVKDAMVSIGFDADKLYKDEVVVHIPLVASENSTAIDLGEQDSDFTTAFGEEKILNKEAFAPCSYKVRVGLTSGGATEFYDEIDPAVFTNATQAALLAQILQHSRVHLNDLNAEEIVSNKVQPICACGDCGHEIGNYFYLDGSKELPGTLEIDDGLVTANIGTDIVLQLVYCGWKSKGHCALPTKIGKSSCAAGCSCAETTTTSNSVNVAAADNNYGRLRKSA